MKESYSLKNVLGKAIKSVTFYENLSLEYVSF